MMRQLICLYIIVAGLTLEHYRSLYHGEITQLTFEKVYEESIHDISVGYPSCIAEAINVFILLQYHSNT